MQSISLLHEGGSKGFHSLVELSGVLAHSILHLDLAVEGSDQIQLFGLHNAPSSEFLH